MKILLNEFISKLIALFFPNRCLICNKLTSHKYFCQVCNAPKPFNVKLCAKCGSPKKHCDCKFHFYYFDKIITCFEKTDNAQTAFYSFKFSENLAGASYFGEIMADCINQAFKNNEIDFITCVPMHSSEKYKRGYNQSELLAKQIAKINRLKYKSLLVQPKATPIQHKASSISERFYNVRGKYKVKHPEAVNGKTVLLVDDIMTTGATISECARELKLSGCEKVYAATALKTLRKAKR
ncbi:MAG: ComF family protein [Clostridia bacterium]|nr:ComF family protein [Clostridia bacterium]